MKTLDKTKKDVERDLVVNMALSLKYKRMSLKQARDLAKKFVSELYESEEELFSKLYELSNSHKEARKVYIKYATVYYEEKRLVDLENLRKNAFMKGKYGN